MSDTPRTDAVEFACDEHDETPASYVARQLERELTAANERIEFLRNAIAKSQEEITQICGKALGYPWYKDDQKNFPGATEQTGVCVGEHVAETIVAELADKYAKANERIKRLEESGDELNNAVKWHTKHHPASNRWAKAKDANQ